MELLGRVKCMERDVIPVQSRGGEPGVTKLVQGLKGSYSLRKENVIRKRKAKEVTPLTRV